MSGLFKSFLWALAYPYFRKRYAIKEAKTKEEKERVFKFRYEIYRHELEHHFLEKIARDGMLYDENDFNENTIILYSHDAENITGTIRITSWQREELPNQIKEKYFIEDSALSQLKIIGEYRFLQVRKDYRKSFLVYALISEVYRVHNKYFKLAPDLIFCDCQPGLLSYYFQLGCFVYTKNLIFKEFGILQIPLVVGTYDLARFKETKNIFYYIAKYYLHSYQKKAPADNYIIKSKRLELTIPRLSPYMTQTDSLAYQKNMASEQAREQYRFMISILKNPLLLCLNKETVIIKKDIMDYDMFLLVEGTIGIFINDILIAELNPGAILGEMALLTDEHIRYTDAVSMTNCKMLLIPRNLIHRLERTNLKQANKLLHILSDGLSKKMDAANKLLYEKSEHKTF